ncbi:MAG: dihydroorotate dehydrogenase [Thermodesulfobacteriota bacterium]
MGRAVEKIKEGPDLSVDIAGIRLKNPVMTASGTCGYGEELSPYMDIGGTGAVVVKGLSLKPRDGNPPPRIVETPAGLINAIGLQNIGVEAFITEKLPVLKGYNVPVIVNIFGESAADYCELAKRLEDTGDINALEINISCPNVKQGGIVYGKDPVEAYNLIKEIRRSTNLVIITKLSPNVTDIKEMARSVEEAGTDSISLINTITAMSVDIEKKRPRLANIIGGLSGPAIRPVAVRMVWEACQVVKAPVIGVGGIMRTEDAIEFFIVGASAVQVGAASLVNPTIIPEIVDGIKGYLVRHGVERFRDIVGTLETN